MLEDFELCLTCSPEDTCRMPSVENGFVSLSDGEHDMEKGTVTVGSVVRSVCTKGYKGNNGDLLRTCTRTGRLTGTPLLCTGKVESLRSFQFFFYCIAFHLCYTVPALHTVLKLDEWHTIL